ncbi:MAG: type II toxin-antitoxin system RelE/ParE family toxin [Janthinobacterium lividum]
MSGPLSHLTAQAIEDFASILERSLAWGAARADRTRRDLLRSINAIAVGEGFGHRRADLDFEQPTLCATVRPHIVIYNPDNRIVLRIIDGLRDLRSLLLSEKRRV